MEISLLEELGTFAKEIFESNEFKALLTTLILTFISGYTYKIRARNKHLKYTRALYEDAKPKYEENKNITNTFKNKNVRLDLKSIDDMRKRSNALKNELNEKPKEVKEMLENE